MSDNKELMIIEITESNAPSIYGHGTLDSFYNHAREHIASEVPDVSTQKGRDRIASRGATVSRSKTAVEKPGRDYLRRIKEQPKIIEAELRDFVQKMDKLRDDTLQPLVEYKAEQARLEAEKKAAEDAAALAIQIEADHEIALLLDEKYEREAEQAKEKLAAEQKARDEAIAAEAAAKATKDAEERAAQAKLDADLAIETERRRAVEAELASERAHKKAEDDRVAALAKAEHDRLDAIEFERKRVAAEKAAEDAKQAELDRAEKARAENKNHQRKINQAILAALTAGGMPEESAKAFISMVARKELPELSINY
jgi:colicin import membrane protein